MRPLAGIALLLAAPLLAPLATAACDVVCVDVGDSSVCAHGGHDFEGFEYGYIGCAARPGGPIAVAGLECVGGSLVCLRGSSTYGWACSASSVDPPLPQTWGAAHVCFDNRIT